MLQLFFFRMSTTVEVFKTNVASKYEAAMLIEMLCQVYPFAQINFDLEDCDRILRIKGSISTRSIVNLLNEKGYLCEELI